MLIPHFAFRTPFGAIWKPFWATFGAPNGSQTGSEGGFKNDVENDAPQIAQIGPQVPPKAPQVGPQIGPKSAPDPHNFFRDPLRNRLGPPGCSGPPPGTPPGPRCVKKLSSRLQFSLMYQYINSSSR